MSGSPDEPQGGPAEADAAVGRGGWRRLILAVLLFGGTGLLLAFGAGLLGISHQQAARQWLAAARGPWGLAAATAAFAVLAFLGAPQFLLIAAAVAVYGPWQGMAYSWVGTLASALVGFGLGRSVADRLRPERLGGRLGRLNALIGANGFLASLAVRLVPFAPFVLVNMAAGASAMGAADFTAGTAIGIVPKIAVIGLAGRGLAAGGVAWAAAAGAAAVWIGAGWAARRWLRR